MSSTHKTVLSSILLPIMSTMSSLSIYCNGMISWLRSRRMSIPYRARRSGSTRRIMKGLRPCTMLSLEAIKKLLSCLKNIVLTSILSTLKDSRSCILLLKAIHLCLWYFFVLAYSSTTWTKVSKLASLTVKAALLFIGHVIVVSKMRATLCYHGTPKSIARISLMEWRHCIWR